MRRFLTAALRRISGPTTRLCIATCRSTISRTWRRALLPSRKSEYTFTSVAQFAKHPVFNSSVCLFVCLFGFLTSSSTTRLYRGRAPRQERLTILRAATHETGLGDHDFCLSRSHYTDTDPTCRERAATAGIEPGTSSPGVARSTAELPPPPPPPPPPPQTVRKTCMIIFVVVY